MHSCCISSRKHLHMLNNSYCFNATFRKANKIVAFQDFVTNKNWMHMDIAGVMSNKKEVPYVTPGMAGSSIGLAK